MDTQRPPLPAEGYKRLVRITFEYLETVNTSEKAQAFVAQTNRIIRDTFARNPHINTGEFFKLLDQTFRNNNRKKIEECEREIEAAKAEVKAASVQLTARLRAARSRGDRVAEYAVWKDKQNIETVCQARIDGAAKRAREGSIQITAYKDLISALGGKSADQIESAISKPAQQTLSKTVTPSQSSGKPLSDLLAELDNLTGLATVKSSVRQLIDLARVEQMRREAGLPVTQVSKHLIFTGNPGTGKTTVARLLAQLYAAIGILKTGQLVEVTRSDLVAGYVGQTAIKTTEAVKRAIGGILFIDEAYTLSRAGMSGQDYGLEAIDTLVKLMEDHREELVVIAAGYGTEMIQFVESNPGLASRFPRTITFPDYSTEELISIFRGMCAQGEYHVSDEAINLLRSYIMELPRTRAFGNGRLIRNIFESSIVRQSSRIIATNSSVLTEITSADLDLC